VEALVRILLPPVPMILISLAVDKIIIAQDSLQEFINTIYPGAYASLTRIKFKALDDLTVKPMGLYGSKEEIVNFLLSIDAVDEAM
jgi:hypothetical protein